MSDAETDHRRLPSLGDSPEAKLPLCPLCGGSAYVAEATEVRDFEYDAPGTFAWMRCSTCGLIRLAPTPSSEGLAAAYPPHYHGFVKPKSKLTQTLIQASRRRAAKGFARRLPEGGTILDVGCSFGHLLSEVGRLGNYRLLGVEFGAEPAAEARRRGIEVWQGDLTQVDIPKESVDVVTMQHVLEHVPDPVATLRKTHSILRPNGLVMGELPNFDSWDASLFGRYWGGGHAPRHLWHFTVTTLRRVLELTGFDSVSIFPSLHTGHWALSIQNWLRRSRTDSGGLTSGRAWYYPLFLVLTIPINLLQMPGLKTGVMSFAARRVP
jgi:SAM-dependent methyltransferase